MKYLIQILLLISTFATPILCFPSGAPNAACESLTPDHGSVSQPPSTNPYELELEGFGFIEADNTYYYVPGVTYTITLRGNSTYQFRGFLIQGRVVVSSPERADGSFLPPPAQGTSVFSFHNCDSTQFPSSSGVTHINGNDKTSVSFQWTAPVGGAGPIQFVYTVVQTMSVFWANVRTVELHERSCVPPEYLVTTFCSSTCPSGTFGNAASATCDQLPPNFSVHTNATAYFTSFQSDAPVGTLLFNYTIYINLNAVGDPLLIFLLLTRTTQLQAIFGFDNMLRTKDYVLPSTTPDDYIVDGIVASFSESIFIRGPFDEDLFGQDDDEYLFGQDDITTVDFTLSTAVVGSASQESFEYDSTVFATVNRPPAKTNDVVVFETNADGSNADLTLNCEVLDYPASTVAWFRGGVALDSPYILSNGTLHIANITEGGFASRVGVVYYCTATNTLGNPAYTATVRSRDITVYYAFFGGFSPSEDPVFLPTTSGITIAMECLVLESQPLPQIEWFLTESGMTNRITDHGPGSLVRILEGGRFLYVRIINTFPREYHCEVANARIHERETGGTRYLVNGSGLVDGGTFVYKEIGNRTAMLRETGFEFSYVVADGLNTLNCNFMIENGMVDIDVPTTRGFGLWPVVILADDGSNVRTVRCGEGTGTVTIFDSVTIPSPPVTNRQAIVGEKPLSFSCASTGLPTPTLEWFINGQPAMDTPGVTISGDTLSIAAPLVSHSGVYQCFASNTAPSGSEARASWALEVREPVSPNPLAFNLTEIGGVSDRQVGALVVRDPGSEVTVSVMVEADPCPSVQWRFGDTAINDGADYTISDPCPAGTSSPFTYSLTVRNLILSRSGQYSATLTNLAGSATLPRLYITVPVTSKATVSNVSLTVQNEPSAQCLLNASTVFITCNTSGFPRPSVSFTSCRDSLSFNLMNRFSQPFVDQLVITNVASTDEGTYTCINEATSERFSMTWNFCTKPVLVSSSSLNTFVGDVLTVECEIAGIPRPTVQWMKNGRILTDSENIEIVSPQRNPDISRVVVRSATSDSDGLYTCTGTNPAGSVSATVTVVVSKVYTSTGTNLADSTTITEGGVQYTSRSTGTNPASPTTVTEVISEAADSLSTESIIGLAVGIPGLLLLFTLIVLVAVLLIRMVNNKKWTPDRASETINPAYYGIVENPHPAANVNSDNQVKENSPTRISAAVDSAAEYD